MSRLYKILLGVFIIVLALLVYTEATRPTPINWFPSYHPTSKIPLGTYVLQDILKQKKQNNFVEFERPPYETLQDSTLSGTYFFINNNIDFDQRELDKLLKFAERGNKIFISSNGVYGALADTLNLDVYNDYALNITETKPLVNLVNPALKAKSPYLLEHPFPSYYFKEIDTLQQTVLGVSQLYNDTLKITQPKVNFIKAPMGDGEIYIHLNPYYLSNYGLLSEDAHTYASGILSYVNDDEILYWDNYYKTGKSVDYSPLRVILNSKYLRWAYYFVLIAVLLFVLFDGKRKQRSIPVIAPLGNKTVAFTETIASMYYDKKEFQKIAEKQILLFFEYIRTHLRIPTEKIDKRFLQAVAARSGNTFEDTQALFTFIEKINKLKNTNPQEVEKLYNAIKEFKQKEYGTS